jgi:hypothetical protein
MAFLKLSSLLTEGRTPTNIPKGCKSGTAQETTKDSYDLYQIKTGFFTWQEEEGIKVYYYYCQKGGSTPPVDPVVDPVVGSDCPDNTQKPEFIKYIWISQGWVDSSGNPDTIKHQSRACGQNGSGDGLSCTYTEALGKKCGPGLKSAWKDLKTKFEEWKKGKTQPIVDPIVDPIEKKKKDCESQGMVYDVSTGGCVAAKQEVDPDAQQLADTIGRYRTSLNSFYDPTGWIALDTLDPDGYTPNFLSLKVLNQITEQIVQLIEQKGSSSDFGSFVEMMELLKEAYNVEKYKVFFQKKFDPSGTDVFASIDALITKINTSATKIKSSLGYDPLTSPTEKQVREFVFRGQLRSIYKSGRLNLMMMVYTYAQNQPLKTDNKESMSEIEGIYSEVSKNRNFENCKNILGIYRETYQEGVYDQSLLVKVTSEIQKCWCEKQYEDLGKLGVKNMFDNKMRKDRKTLIGFLNQLPSATMGDFAVRLDDSVCTKNKKYR